jgi:phosphopentomutase
MDIERVIVIVLDGVGVGATDDAHEYGDEGSNSVANTAVTVDGLNLPNMGAIGLGNLTTIQGVPPRKKTKGAFGKMMEKSAGKGSVVGHWELMGVYTPIPFPTYPGGFPEEIIEKFIRTSSAEGVLGNYPASGTEIIQELGEEHISTAYPIVYTSADSVFQIAAHEEVIPIEELYDLCLSAREILAGEHSVGRVIARPFIGDSRDNFKRTERRRDYPLAPTKDTVMDKLITAGNKVYATGKIDDLFGHRGISASHHTVDNEESVQGLIDFLAEDFSGLLISNLIEFDMIYGHRNDPRGFADKLEAFDKYIPEIEAAMTDSDIAMIVADHGVDPTTASTDHSREYVPLLVFGSRVKHDVDLGVRDSFSDVASTIAEIFRLEPPEIGKSFLEDILVK